MLVEASSVDQDIAQVANLHVLRGVVEHLVRDRVAAGREFTEELITPTR